MPEVEVSLPGKGGKADLYYLDPQPAGSPAVLLLHGLGANSASWQLQMPALLDAGLRPLALDLPGFGRSRLAGRWSIASLAGAAARLLEVLDTGPAMVVGISMGGTVALQFGLDYPHLARKLVLVNTFANLRPAQPGGWLYFAWRFLLVHTLGLETQAQFVARRIFPGSEQEFLRQELVAQILTADPRSYRAAMRALGLFDARGRLGTVRMPVLVVTGERDTTVPLRAQHDLVKGLPGACQVMVKDAGHAVSVDQPEAFNLALLDFILERSLQPAAT